MRHREVMAELVDRGADVNASPYQGTALTTSAYGNRIASAKWLLDHGADPSLRHDFGGQSKGIEWMKIHRKQQPAGAPPESCMGTDRCSRRGIPG